MLYRLRVARSADTTLRRLLVFAVRNDRNLQRHYKMECNIEEIGGQILESSSVENVIRVPLNDEKEWQDWLQDFQLKSNSA